jgi:gamma-glutamylcyclotransferase (GGCT)/AIG2-like uncharacterized protein YtfP
MSAVRLFVYGSLRRDAEGRAHPLLAGATYLGAAAVRGALYQVDWYPGLVLGGEGDVHGELYEIPLAHVDAMLAALDDYEGGGYRRRKVPATLEGVEVGDVWAYAYLGAVHALTPILSGDYGTPVHRARP